MRKQNHLEWEYVPGLVCCDEEMREWRVRWRETCGVLVYRGKYKGNQWFFFAMPHERGDHAQLYKHPFMTPGRTYDEVIENVKMLCAELLTRHTPKKLWSLGEPWVITLTPPSDPLTQENQQ
jgi:hypothetical protein